MSAEPTVPSEPAADRLETAVRRGLRLAADAPVSLREVGELSNINYVYRVDVPGRTFYLKVVPEIPKRLPIRLPRERVFSEAEGLLRFHVLAGDDVVIPEVLFVDGREMALGMSDVGEGRDNLFNVITSQFDLLLEQAEGLGRALGRVHHGTRGTGSPRPPMEEIIIRKVVFDGLLAPGAMYAFPELAADVLAEMKTHHECLVHGDLWSKNLLVRRGAPVALVDFEGVLYGDPAFDLGTLIAVALVPALDHVELLDDALEFSSRFLAAWTSTCGSTEWAGAVVPRTFRATATFLAARAFGPFAYVLSDDGRQRIGELAHSLAQNPPPRFDEFAARVRARG
jgi:tRNA A-37 threonylcarbamoyl transferase component Bud32